MAQYASVVRPDITVVTSIGSEHHRSMRSLEATCAEKAEMVRSLRASGLAVLNGDDPNVRGMAGQTVARVVTFGFDEANDVRAGDVSLTDWPYGTRFTLHAGGESRPVRIRQVGRTMVYPALAAVAVGLAEGLSLDKIVPLLETIAPAPGRLEPIQLPSGAVILRDDYKSSMETVEAALEALREIPAKRRIVVLGEVSEPPGPQGEIYRYIGARIARVASRAIFLCRERNSACRAGATGAGMPPSSIFKAGKDLFKATEILRKQLGPGDVALIKGRDIQRLDRMTLMLQGRTVKCRIPSCKAQPLRCRECPALQCGWGSSTVMSIH